jgi:hypothetical protein
VAAAHSSAPGAKVAPPRPSPPANPTDKTPQVPQANSFLTYDASGKVTPPKWPVRSAILVVSLLSATMALAILVRSQSKRVFAPEAFSPSSNTLGTLATATPSDGTAKDYDAAPLDTGDGQVLTVVAGPQQTLKDLSLRYVGRFDSDVAEKIRSLNPDLKDPDHLEEGQLVRIPLPPGAMKKVNDTQESATPPEQKSSTGFFGRFTALLRARR